MATISLAEKLRKNLGQALEDNQSDYNKDQIVPDYGKTKVRIIPGMYSFGEKGENELFYWNSAYHFLPGATKEEKGEYVFTNQAFADGSSCPIDEAVEELFKTKDEKIRSIASQIKRKRVYYFHAILYKEGEAPKLVIIKDNTSEGKLANKICTLMGMPFVKDATQKRPWIIKTELAEGKQLFDLIDLDKGHDLLIDKRKGKAFKLPNGATGNDIDYSETFAYSEPRALTAEERELIKELPDLKTINKIETDRSVVEAKLNKFMSKVQIEESSGPEEKASAPVPPKNPALNVKTDEASEDAILAELRAAAG
jgi:ribosomal protein L23